MSESHKRACNPVQITTTTKYDVLEAPYFCFFQNHCSDIHISSCRLLELTVSERECPPVTYYSDSVGKWYILTKTLGIMITYNVTHIFENSSNEIRNIQPDKTRKRKKEEKTSLRSFFNIQFVYAVYMSIPCWEFWRIITFFYSCNPTFVIITHYTGQPSGTFFYLSFNQCMRQNVIDVSCFAVHISHLRAEILHRSRIYHVFIENVTKRLRFFFRVALLFNLYIFNDYRKNAKPTIVCILSMRKSKALMRLGFFFFFPFLLFTSLTLRP